MNICSYCYNRKVAEINTSGGAPTRKAMDRVPETRRPVMKTGDAGAPCEVGFLHPPGTSRIRFPHKAYLAKSIKPTSGTGLEFCVSQSPASQWIGRLDAVLDKSPRRTYFRGMRAVFLRPK